MDSRQLPPQSIDSEQAVLGSILIDNDCMAKVSTMISVDDFYRENHRLIFDACRVLHSTKNPIDFVTLSDHLKSKGALEEVGGGAYLLTLCDFTPTAANVSHYCHIVKDKAIRRRMICHAIETIAAAHDGGVAVADSLQKAKTEISNVAGDASGASVSDIRTLQDRAEAYIKYVGQVGSLRFRTGLRDIDNAIRGVAPGEVLTIIAYSGTYKSALLQNLLIGAAERTGLFQIFFSMEMPEQKIFEREVQIQCDLQGREVEELFKGRDWKYQYQRLIDQKSNKILTCDKSRLSIPQISNYVEMARHKHGQIGGVGIDYLGLMKAEGKSLFDKVSALSADLKGMAKKCNVPVVILCQVNRGYAQSQNKEIEMDAAKGGGDIEAGADFMLGLWMANDTLCCKLLKNRNGPSGLKWEIDIDPPTLRFLGTREYTQDKQQDGYQKRSNLPDF